MRYQIADLLLMVVLMQGLSGTIINISAQTVSIKDFSNSLVFNYQENQAESLNKAIADGIKMLEAKDYHNFLKRYPLPADLEQILKKRTFDELVNGFAENNAEQLLQALKQVVNRQPQFNDDKTEAIFKLDQQIKSHGDVTFKLVDGVWHIKN